MKKVINVFISHSVEDSKLAFTISETLKNLSLNQICTWFSSSPNPGEGISPGDSWFNRICNEISRSKILIVLLTPNSITRPWIYFECGVAQGLDDCKIIPICIGVNKSDVAPPLGSYQCYQLSDYDSASNFFKNLLKAIEIPYIEEMMKGVVLSCITNTQNALVVKPIVETTDPQIVKSVIDNLRYHIDKRFFELVGVAGKEKKATPHAYTIVIENHMKKELLKYYIEVDANTTVQNVLDRIYYLIEGEVKPYSYMQSWILQNAMTGAKMVMYEITESVKASIVFEPNVVWRILKLKKPYTTVESLHYQGFGLLQIL